MSAIPASAQNQSVNSNTATAVLHLRANVVPVAFASRVTVPENKEPVSYNIPVRPAFVDVTEQVRELHAATPSTSAGMRVLKTTVVLPR